MPKIVFLATDVALYALLVGIACYIWHALHSPTLRQTWRHVTRDAPAMAAGVLLLRRGSAEGKVALFMSADQVKFRKAVRPGDQLVINAKLTRTRGNKIATAEVTCSVDGLVVSSSELMFTVVDEEKME